MTGVGWLQKSGANSILVSAHLPNSCVHAGKPKITNIQRHPLLVREKHPERSGVYTISQPRFCFYMTCSIVRTHMRLNVLSFQAR